MNKAPSVTAISVSRTTYDIRLLSGDDCRRRRPAHAGAQGAIGGNEEEEWGGKGAGEVPA
jgi:hypothetical protein